MNQIPPNIVLAAMNWLSAFQDDLVLCFNFVICYGLFSVMFWKPLCTTLIVDANVVWVFVFIWAMNHVSLQ